MSIYSKLLIYLLFFQAGPLPKARPEFHWDWRNAHSITYKNASLKEAKIGDSDKAIVARAIKAKIRPHMWALGIKSEGQLERATLDTKVQSIHLNENNAVEIIAQVEGFCSADGNCPLWFFRKTPQGYKLLLDGLGESFTVQPTATNGFKDLVVAMHFSAFEQNLRLYRYAAGRYWRVACYDAAFAVDYGNRPLKEPRIRPSGCN